MNRSIKIKDINMNQENAALIVNLALNGDTRYSHEAIGDEGGDINEMGVQTGGVLVERTYRDTDIAIYDCGPRWALVADCNGPIVVWVNK